MPLLSDKRRLAMSFQPLKPAAPVSGSLLILIAALCWGLAGGLGGFLVGRGWDPVVISLYRGALTLLFGAVWLACAPAGHGLGNPRLWVWSGLAGAGVAGNFAFYFLTMADSSVPVAATLLYTAPIYVFVVGFLSGSERPSLGKLAGLAVVALGIVLLTDIASAAPSALRAGTVATGLMSGVSYAVFLFAFRNAGAHGSPQSVLTLAFTAECLILFAIVTDRAWARGGAPVDLGAIALFGLVGGGISFLLYIRGLKSTPPTLAAVTAMAEPVSAAAFGLVLLNQRLTLGQICGAGLVIAAVTFLNTRYRQRR